MDDIGISTIGILIILIVLVVFCTFLYREHWAEKMKEIQHWCIEKFMWAEHWANEAEMWESIHDWTYWCPDATKECRTCLRCTQCHGDYGWYETMRAKYCERSDPNGDPRIFIKELCEARRARCNNNSEC